ncbi:MAG: hypothetical protein CMN30_15070 [Sandaracinus sp.]|nr:hypothetical protein [Sandaracinus sp.]|tara:strand:+ start:2331 stop:2828 length:498 start_codon:yes stop_codon:yes gene_type:complete
METLRLGGIVLFLALALGACGGDDDGAAAGDDETTTDGGDTGDGPDCTGQACRCPSTGDCEAACTVFGCSMYCTDSANCTFECGEGCNAMCRGTGECEVSVAGASTVDCSGTGGCDVTCTDNCAVYCSGDGPCRLADCPEGATCTLEQCEITECPDGSMVCNRDC